MPSSQSNLAPYLNPNPGDLSNRLLVVNSLPSGSDHLSATPASVSMATTLSDMVSSQSASSSGSVMPSSENLPPATPVLNSTIQCGVDHASFNPNSLLVTSPTTFTLLPTSSPSFFPFTACYPSSFSSAAMMAAAMGRVGGVSGVCPLAPRPGCPYAEQVMPSSEDSSGPSKKINPEAS